MKALEVPIPDLETHQVLYTVSLEVPIRIEEDGTEIMTAEGAALIQKTQSRHLGLLQPEEIKLLRKRLGKTQEEMSKLLGCGAKSYTRWETGHSRPTRMVNNLLRLLWCSKINERDLKTVQLPRLKEKRFSTRIELPIVVEYTHSVHFWHTVRSVKSTVTLDEQKLYNSQHYRRLTKNEFTTSA